MPGVNRPVGLPEQIADIFRRLARLESSPRIAQMQAQIDALTERVEALENP